MLCIDLPQDVRTADYPGIGWNAKRDKKNVGTGPADSGTGPLVTITGSNIRSVFYGVYDLLERRAGCHWFWDGDVVPRRDTIDLSGLDIHEEARFEWRGLRYFAHRGLTRFQAEHWGFEYWRHEIDWLLKRRLNVFMLRIGQDDLFRLVWDIRDDKWADAYWKLTTTAVEAFGRPGGGLLHTISLGERLCYREREKNLELKLMALDKFLKRAHRDYPKKKVLLAGWDFYFTWYPDEVKALVKTLDPERDIIWDYEGDATQDYRPEMKKVGGNDFTKWGVVGKFPYTYSIFLAFENALDVRANYDVIEARQKLVQGDPMCKGFVFWPEASHTDPLCIRYFTANAWSHRPVPHGEVLKEFCASRGGGRGLLAPRGRRQDRVPAR